MKFDALLSPLTPEIEETGDHAAKMSTPGAAISGYTINTKLRLQANICLMCYNVCSMHDFTLRMFGVTIFGPLEEKGAT